MTIGYGVPDQYFRGCRLMLPLITVEMFVQIFLDALLIGARGRT